MARWLWLTRVYRPSLLPCRSLRLVPPALNVFQYLCKTFPQSRRDWGGELTLSSVWMFWEEVVSASITKPNDCALARWSESGPQCRSKLAHLLSSWKSGCTIGRYGCWLTREHRH